MPASGAVAARHFRTAHSLLAVGQVPREDEEVLGVDVVSRLSLTPADWLLVPAGLPALRAAVLARSCAEAAQRAPRLLSDDRMCTAPLSLAHQLI